MKRYPYRPQKPARAKTPTIVVSIANAPSSLRRIGQRESTRHTLRGPRVNRTVALRRWIASLHFLCWHILRTGKAHARPKCNGGRVQGSRRKRRQPTPAEELAVALFFPVHLYGAREKARGFVGSLSSRRRYHRRPGPAESQSRPPRSLRGRWGSPRSSGADCCSLRVRPRDRRDG